MHLAALFDLLGDAQGGAFPASLKANGVRIASSNGEVKRLVVEGEVAFGLCDTDDGNEALKEGAKVEIVYPDQDGIGTLVMPTTAVIVRRGPNPKTARRLIDYLLSTNVEQTMAEQAAHMPLRKSPVPACRSIGRNGSFGNETTAHFLFSPFGSV